MKILLIMATLVILLGIVGGAQLPAHAETDAAPDRANVTARDAAPSAAGATQPLDAGASEPSSASAQEADESEADREDVGVLTNKALALAHAGKWLALLGVAMLLGAALLRKIVFRNVKWFQTKLGGYASAAIISVLTIIGLAIEVGFSMDVVLAGLSAGGLSGYMHTVTNDVKASRSG